MTGHLQIRNGCRVLHTWGDPYQSGWQHGRLLRQEVAACFDEVWRNGFLVASPLFPPLLWRGYAAWNARHFNDAEIAELMGVADGSGVPFDDILLMNSQSPLDIARSWFDPHSYGGGCSTFAARGDATADGGMLIGRTFDTINLNRLHRYAVVQVHHPSSGHAFITPGFAGKVLDAVTGWNAMGLHVSQDDAEARWQNPYGLYSGALMRRMVQHAATIEEALALLDHLPALAAGARSFLLADGHRAVLAEMRQDVLQGLDGTRLVTVRRLGEAGDRPDTLSATNHFLTPGQVRRVRPPSESSRTRLTRLRQLLETAWGSLDAAGARAILMDKLDLKTGDPGGHLAPSDRIINWFGPRILHFGPFPVRAELMMRVATTAATVSEMQRQVMWVACGDAWVSDAAAFQPFSVAEELERYSARTGAS